MAAVRQMIRGRDDNAPPWWRISDGGWMDGSFLGIVYICKGGDWIVLKISITGLDGFGSNYKGEGARFRVLF